MAVNDPKRTLASYQCSARLKFYISRNYEANQYIRTFIYRLFASVIEVSNEKVAIKINGYLD